MLQWPCPTPDHPGTKFLHQGTFGRELGLFSAIDYQPSEELPDEQYPFFLATGRHYAHYNARTMTGRCPSLEREYSQAITQMNVNDAARLGANNGDRIRISSRRGEVVSTARTGDVVTENAIFMDFHFPEANSNVLLGTSLDPITKNPDYKVYAVRIDPA